MLKNSYKSVRKALNNNKNTGKRQFIKEMQMNNRLGKRKVHFIGEEVQI